MAVVCDHDVPIFCIDQAEIRSTPWDLTIKQVEIYIDAEWNIRQIYGRTAYASKSS